jgi:hypothetical protein
MLVVVVVLLLIFLCATTAPHLPMINCTTRLVAAAVGYCFYFDRKRRSAPGFKEAHREKRKVEQVAAQKAADAALAAKRAAAGGGPGRAPAGLAEMLGGQQQKHPQRDEILAEANQLSEAAHKCLDEAPDASDPKVINMFMQLISKSLQTLQLTGEQQMLQSFVTMTMKRMQTSGHAAAIQQFVQMVSGPR